tara:strand:- start:103 stop:1536 length:1434 start_codon:yes stop_codon:yes gene_type:complete
LETKFDFKDENFEKDLKKNASGLFNGILIFIKSVFSFYKDVDKNGTINSIKKDISMRGTTAWILICSILIASVGLNADSTAVVIGAMLISPLLGPILGLGLSISTNDIDTLKSSIINTLVMVFLSIGTAYIFFISIPISEETPELLSRTSPDIRDVLIAFFGGLALIIAKTKKENISSAIFGVAIATALMPPLCTVGYYLAEGELLKARGAILLFLINTLYIIVATYLTLKVLRFPLIVYANSRRRRFIANAIALIAISSFIFAGYKFRGVIKKSTFETEARNFLNTELSMLSNGDYLSKSAKVEYNDGESEIIINTFGQKPISKDLMDLLNKKIKINENLKSTKLLFIQQEIEDSYTLNNTFLKELRSRDSIDIARKKYEIENLSEEINQLRSLSEEKLLFSSLINEAKLIYPDLNSFEIYETIRTDFQKTDTVVVVSISWSDIIDDNNKLQLNQSIKNWIGLKFESKNIEIIEKN